MRMRIKTILQLVSLLLIGVILSGCQSQNDSINITAEFIKEFDDNYKKLEDSYSLWENTLRLQGQDETQNELWEKILYYETICGQYATAIINNSNSSDIQQECERVEQIWRNWVPQGYYYQSTDKSKYGGYTSNGIHIELLSPPITSHEFAYEYTINRIRNDEQASDFLNDSYIYVEDSSNIDERYYAIEVFVEKMEEKEQTEIPIKIRAISNTNPNESITAEPLKSLEGTPLKTIFERYHRNIHNIDNITTGEWNTFVFRGLPYDVLELQLGNSIISFNSMKDVYLEQ